MIIIVCSSVVSPQKGYCRVGKGSEEGNQKGGKGNQNEQGDGGATPLQGNVVVYGERAVVCQVAIYVASKLEKFGRKINGRIHCKGSLQHNTALCIHLMVLSL